ncbi:hypothetical protein FD755_002758 [Muntiacus reevesi]|uniref:Uncharacterized protein n=1 Tax=Muntiacus reevesi TaxID=9886 RepID=A0A5J5N6G5_MUNRE|nr:hypothetical protein FD755_002758 [Muntiacus reevesi]
MLVKTCYNSSNCDDIDPLNEVSSLVRRNIREPGHKESDTTEQLTFSPSGHSAESKLQLSAMQEKHDDSHKFKLGYCTGVAQLQSEKRHTEKSSDLKKLICILCYRVFLITSDYILANSKVFLFSFALEDNSLEESCGGLPPVEEGDRKISLIMELSTQVSLQTEKITQLEEVLEEKERKIQQLEAEREAHCFPEVKDSPECLQETPISL